MAYDLCVATDNFAQCIGAIMVRGIRVACGIGDFCRGDFMCSAAHAGASVRPLVSFAGYASMDNPTRQIGVKPTRGTDSQNLIMI
ncbi:hypothetical protein V5F79_16310 [Xanthobacter flavus]|uniref:hypothetical protein n=1 Tax=Xanthobacter flavus TaxID=281 RepID=UPI00372B9760